MTEQILKDGWNLQFDGRMYACRVPCSVYDTLCKAGVLPDPYDGMNEYRLTGVCDGDAVFETEWTPGEGLRQADRVELVFEGIDTLAEVTLNGRMLGAADNMHRTWVFDIRQAMREGPNRLRVAIASPNRYIAARQAERPLWGVDSTMAGYPHLRKAHYMFGWDWGPQLPDMGIWRSVRVRGYRAGRIRDVYYTQRHEEGRVLLSCQAELEAWTDGLTAELTVVSPDGTVLSAPIADGRAEVAIERPRLWWVRGLGDQPLYTCCVTLRRDGETVDRYERRIGLRTLTVSQEPDAWGREFCFINNGVRVFAMGANVIPEDQLLPRCTPERTARFLRDCERANYNFLRVWGGGIYPADDFYNWCDEHGLVVWQDFMFACSAYRLTPAFEATVRREVEDNVRRLRNHACLGLWCGNNEIESAWVGWNLPEDPEAEADYLTLFESLIPDALRRLDPETFYWPSSPSSGGGFRDPSSNQAGDMHYWAVWHNFKPIEAFRREYYRFCSEYGFESVPDMKTVRTFCHEKKPDLCGRVMEAHQKCTQGNEKIMYYLAQMVNYPESFERLVYCTQLVQADCIRSNVEHMRRARGRCMGSAYWQVNDSNPVISWSSLDYYGRWKALHYAARRFYAPLLLSCDDTDPLRPVLTVTNDTRTDEMLTVVCRLRDRTAAVRAEWRQEVRAAALSAAPCLALDLTQWLPDRQARETLYIEYALLRGAEPVSAGTTLFVRPKAFDFLPAGLRVSVEDRPDAFVLTLTADAFAKSVCLGLREADAVFSDNWFDVHGPEPVTVTLEKAGALADWTADTLRRQLTVVSYWDGQE